MKPIRRVLLVGAALCGWQLAAEGVVEADRESMFSSESGSTISGIVYAKPLVREELPAFELKGEIKELCEAFETIVLTGEMNRMALRRLEIAADNGHLAAKGLLGLLLQRSSSSPDKMKGAAIIDDIFIDLVQKEESDEGARLCLGLCHLWGCGTNEDEEEAQELLGPLERRGLPWVKGLLAQPDGELLTLKTGAERPEGGGGGEEERKMSEPNENVTRYLKEGQDIDEPDAEGWTPLQRAAQKGDVAGCLELLQRGASVNKADKAGWTPLMIAAEAGYTDVCDLLLVKGAFVDHSNKRGTTPLYIAAQKGHFKVCKLLLANRATVDQAMKEGANPLYIAAKKGHREVCELLLANGANPLKKTTYGKTPIDVAETEEIRGLLSGTGGGGGGGPRRKESVPDAVAPYLKPGQDVNEPDALKWTPLQLAAEKGDVEGCLGLIQRGAAVDQASDDGWTPLLVAAWNGHQAVCKLLLAKGASADNVISNGATPLFIAAWNGHLAVCDLLLANGAAADKVSNTGRTPLHIAPEKGHREVCELLLDNGADSRKKNYIGKTPIDVAKTEEIKALLAVAPYLKPGQNANEPNANDWTPLQRAALRGDLQGSLGLFQKGANADHPNKNGYTPLYVAAREGHRDVCELLLAKGANPLKKKRLSGKTAIDVAKTEEIEALLRQAVARQEQK